MILIDSSAGSRDLILYPPLNNPSLATLSDLSISSDSNSSVDVCFSGNGQDGSKLMIGIEFCSLSDLLSKITTGRLQATQVPHMLSEYDICWIIYYGAYRCNEDDNLEILSPAIFKKREDNQYYWCRKAIPSYGPFSSRSLALEDYQSRAENWSTYDFIGNKPMKWGYLESSLLSLSRAGIQSKNFSTISQCAKWIACEYRWWQKSWKEHKSLRTFDKSRDGREANTVIKSQLQSQSCFRPSSILPAKNPVAEIIMSFARQIDGIDYERAYAVGQHFDSVESMILASEDEWRQVPGIGKVLAKVAVETIKRKKGSREDKSAPTPQHGLNLGLLR